MFLECKSYDGYWALTKNDLYHLKEDGDESRCYLIDDNGTELDVCYIGYGRWALSADDDFVFEEYNGEEPEDE